MADGEVVYDIAGFNDLLLLSFVSDLFFKRTQEKNLIVKQDMSAYTAVQLIDLSSVNTELLKQSFQSFMQDNRMLPNARRVFRYFVFSADDLSKYPEDTVSQLAQMSEEFYRNGIISEFVIIDIKGATVRTVDGKKVSDRKIRAIFEKSLAWYRESLGLGVSADTVIKNKKREAVRKYEDLGEIRRKDIAAPVIVLLLMNIMIFIAGLVIQQKSGVDMFKVLGIQDNELIRNGEWWRLFTSMFLHADIAHLTGNMFFLFYLGTVVYRYYNTLEFYAVYFLSGLLGNLLSFCFTDYRSLGASGAIMGLGGLIIYRMFFGKNAKVFRNSGNYFTFVLMILFNLFYGVFAVEENIDNYGHFGGFIGGFLIGIIITYIRKAIADKKSDAEESRM